jgi:hypothetical protein
MLRIGKLPTISTGLILGPLGKVGEPVLSDVVRRLIDLLKGVPRG